MHAALKHVGPEEYLEMQRQGWSDRRVSHWDIVKEGLVDGEKREELLEKLLADPDDDALKMKAAMDPDTEAMVPDLEDM